MQKNKKQKNSTVDKTYYIFGHVDTEIEKFRNKINAIIYLRDRKRNIKKYELLNALSLIGLKHKSEVLKELGIMDIDEKDVL